MATHQQPKEDNTILDSAFNTWEKWFETCSRALLESPSFLDMMGNVMTQSNRIKILVDKAIMKYLEAWHLPSSESTDRLLYMMNKNEVALEEIKERLDRIEKRLGTTSEP